MTADLFDEVDIAGTSTRQAGTWTVQPVLRPKPAHPRTSVCQPPSRPAAEAEAPRMRSRRRRHRMPSSRSIPAARSMNVPRLEGRRIAIDDGPRARPAPVASRRASARAIARRTARGRRRARTDTTPRCAQTLARRADRLRLNHAPRTRSAGWSRRYFRIRAAHHAGYRRRALGIGDDQHVRVERRAFPSSVVSVSPARARRTTIAGPANRARSKACIGWPSSSST